MYRIIMPKAGQTMVEGTVERWLKREGDRVLEGEAVLEIETDKAVMEVPSEADGFLRKIVVGEGETVPVLTTLGYVGDMTEELPHSSQNV